MLGYFIHLYTDYLWIKYFLSEIIDGCKITRIDGNIVNVTKEEKVRDIYEDYTNLNVKIIEKYNLDLKSFYSEVQNIKSVITEIPLEKLELLIEKAGSIIINSTYNKSYMFDITDVSNFIELSVKLILLKLNDFI